MSLGYLLLFIGAALGVWGTDTAEEYFMRVGGMMLVMVGGMMMAEGD